MLLRLTPERIMKVTNTLFIFFNLLILLFIHSSVGKILIKIFPLSFPSYNMKIIDSQTRISVPESQIYGGQN